MKTNLNNILQWISNITIVLFIPCGIISIFGELLGVVWIEKLISDIGLSYNFFIITSLILFAIFVVINVISCKYLNK